jgi:hypothetical protein
MHCCETETEFLDMNSVVLNSTVEHQLYELIETASHPDMQKIRIIGYFLENGLHWQFEAEKNSTKDNFRLHIYLRTNKTLFA